ncbi:MAG: M12 family metallo-peptidase, partial [Bacteroidota bacterium]
QQIRKAAKASSLSVDLFQPLPKNDRSIVVDAGIDDYQLLQLDDETRSDLYRQAPDELKLKIPTNGTFIELSLNRVYLAAEGFRISTASGKGGWSIDPSLHYRGTVIGEPKTQVAFSLLPDELQGLIAKPNGQNLVLGPLAGQEENSNKQNRSTYIFYDDSPVFKLQTFDCQTADSGIPYEHEDLHLPHEEEKSTNGCVKVYFEVDYDIFQEKGSNVANAAAHVTAAFNQVALLYEASNANLTISEIFVWDQVSPYAGSSSGTILSQFQNTRTSFNGDIAQLLSYKASGGIAVLNGLCHPLPAARMSFASIATSFNNVPTYSWTIMVMAHELGHQLGSQHTHACVWNGNGTAIDGCAGFTEGNCSTPGLPSGGGNIMSYCHITSVGINFNVGFGTQPAAVIFNSINNSSCITDTGCSTPPGDGNGGGGNPGGGGGNGGGDGGDSGGNDEFNCETNTLYLELTPDLFGPETTWTLETESGEQLYVGGPYRKKLTNTTFRDTFCLPDGCYVFHILDEDEDGICCAYGEGSYKLLDAEGNTLAGGGEFEAEELTDFCLPDGQPPVGDDCTNINFITYPVISYGINQDAGQASIADAGNELEIRNNAWKAIELQYTLTEQTVLEFDFKSTIEGEIHGIGFDDNLSISSQFTFRLHGTQNWGISNFANYTGNGQWQHYVIPVGEFLLGDADYLFFTADHDVGARNANSFFKNVTLYEGLPCNSDAPTTEMIPTSAPSLRVYPNPASDQIQVNAPGAGSYTILNTSGVVLKTGLIDKHLNYTVSIAELPAGVYIIRYQGEGGTAARQFTRIE